MAEQIASIVIAAHNEAGSIGGVVKSITDGDPLGEIEVVVAANGCTDQTAAIARGVSPRVKVLELPLPSKTAALNAADSVASAFPRIYLDADVRIDTATIRALVEATSDPSVARIAAPRFDIDTSGSSWAIRQYFKVWRESDYARRGHIGGAFGISAAGRARFGAFPDIIADDRFIQLQFADDERRILATQVFSVAAPRNLAAQIRRSVRVHAGNAQLRDATMGTAGPSSRFSALIRRCARRPALWPGLTIYSFGYAVARIRAERLARGNGRINWRRDETTRTALW